MFDPVSFARHGPSRTTRQIASSIVCDGKTGKTGKANKHKGSSFPVASRPNGKTENERGHRAAAGDRMVGYEVAVTDALCRLGSDPPRRHARDDLPALLLAGLARHPFGIDGELCGHRPAFENLNAVRAVARTCAVNR
jgi:hypothetical protein